MTFTAVPGRPALVTLPDRRELAYAAYGPDDGKPVLFLPGAGVGRRMQFGGDQLAERHVRLLSVDRPGLGHSSPDPQKSLSSVAADLQVLVHQQGLETVPVVANSQGAPFGLAAALAGLASRLVLVSPSDEVADDRVRSQLPAPVRGFVDHLNAVSPAVGARLFADYTADSLVAFILEHAADLDAELYQDRAFRRLLEDALRDGFAPGPAGYAVDTVLATRPWRLPLDHMKVPVSIWYGTADATHSPDLGLILATRIPGCSRHLVEGEGGSLLWTRPDLVLGEALLPFDH